MDANDTIARVYPFRDVKTGFGNLVVASIKASSYYVPPQRESIQEVRYGRDDREMSEPPAQKEEENTDLDYLPCIEIRFSKPPRSPHGIIFGCSSSCDVVLPNFKGLSNSQFSFTFDGQRRLIVKDLSSSTGTQVTYGKGGKGFRRNFVWIVGGDDNAQQDGDVVIRVHDQVQLLAVVTKHDISHQSYIDNVEKFGGAATAEDRLENLEVFRPDTERPTGAHTPGEGPIYLERNIGDGGFGEAIRRWNVSTGYEFVIKRPLKGDERIHVRDRKMWKKEANILQRLTHPHIVKFLDVVEEPLELHMEFIRGGPLSRLGNVTITESVSILTQCLSALEYLHGQQLAHRDIKPSNILIRSREPFEVVLADFGLSKESTELHTDCGTRKYTALEVSNSSIRPYSTAVDIWSLGVVMCEILGILPDFRKYRYNPNHLWCNKVVDSLRELTNRRPDRLKTFLLQNMLCISPNSRSSAQVCYTRAMDLSGLLEKGEAYDEKNKIFWQEASVSSDDSDDSDESDSPTQRPERPAADDADADSSNNDERSLASNADREPGSHPATVKRHTSASASQGRESKPAASSLPATVKRHTSASASQDRESEPAASSPPATLNRHTSVSASQGCESEPAAPSLPATLKRHTSPSASQGRKTKRQGRLSGPDIHDSRTSYSRDLSQALRDAEGDTKNT